VRGCEGWQAVVASTTRSSTYVLTNDAHLPAHLSPMRKRCYNKCTGEDHLAFTTTT
jgi:hypothetical protein